MPSPMFLQSASNQRFRFHVPGLCAIDRAQHSQPGGCQEHLLIGSAQDTMAVLYRIREKAFALNPPLGPGVQEAKVNLCPYRDAVVFSQCPPARVEEFAQNSFAFTVG